MRSTVVLPEPEGPMIETFSPRGDVEVELVEHRQRRRSAWTTLSKRTMGGIAAIGHRWASGSAWRFEPARMHGGRDRLITRKKTPTRVIGSV